jgi:hypothetical protein
MHASSHVKPYFHAKDVSYEVYRERRIRHHVCIHSSLMFRARFSYSEDLNTAASFIMYSHSTYIYIYKYQTMKVTKLVMHVLYIFIQIYTHIVMCPMSRHLIDEGT